MQPVLVTIPCVALLLSCGSNLSLRAEEKPPVESSAAVANAPVDYVKDVRPILRAKCAMCHNEAEPSGGLRLDAVAHVMKGGDSGPVLVAGNSAESRLIQAVLQTGDLKMPPPEEGKPLEAAQIEILRRWIDDGAKIPDDENQITHWAFLKPVRPAVPQAEGTGAVHPIDAFIAQQYAARGLGPIAPAPKHILLRRVYLDLIGLPPTPEQLAAFENDSSPDSYEKVVDQLLASSHYGERWGRHWMDVWRYSDWYGSRGINEIRYSQRHIWRWRDWIVESLNEDKPYDRMVMEMLAGDELAPADPNVLRATGYLGRNWYKFDRNVWMFDTVEQTSQAFLGLTMKCARCHDHKFDPITQEDYYHFRAFFEPHDVRTDPISGSQETEKDATLGAVLREGVARVYDKELDAKTYVFERGDNRYPDQSRLMSPAVPKALGSLAKEIQTVALSADAWQPHLRGAVAEGIVKNAESEIALATEKIRTTQAEAKNAQQALAALSHGWMCRRCVGR
jgi:hypothetical protein